MRHLRKDYDAIQPWPTKRPHYIRDVNRGVNDHIDNADIDMDDEPQPIIPDDEPVFILRPTDVLAPRLVREWANLRDAETGNPTVLSDRVRAWADEMEAYAAEHYDGGKIPDTPAELLR